MSKEKLSLTKQSQILIIGQTISFSFNFLIPIIVVRYLDMSQYGIYKQLFLVFMTVSILLPFGLVESLYYFVPRNREQKQYYITQTCYFLVFSGGLFLLIIIIFGRGILSCINLSHLYNYSVALSLYIVFMVISLPFEKLLIIEERVKAASIITVISEMIKGMSIILVTILTRDIKVILYALVLFSFLRVIVFYSYLFYNKLLLFSLKNLNVDKMKELINYSFPFGMAVVVATIRRFLHQYFVTAMYTTRDFAIYAAGSFQLPLMNTIYLSVSNVVLIKISEYQKHGRHEKILEIWRNSARKLSMIYFPVTIIFIIASGEFVTILYTTRYMESIPIFAVTLLQLPFDIFITHSILKSFAETRFILKLNLVLLMVTAVLLYLFIRYYGMIGATLATVVSLGLIRIIEILKVKKLLGVSFYKLIPWKIIIKISGVCLLCSIPTLFLKSLMAYYSPIQVFFAETSLFLSLYVTIIYYSGLLIDSEKEDIKRMIEKLKLYSART